MKKKINFLALFTAFVIISQSILVSLVAIFYLNAQYEDKMLEFSDKATTIKIHHTASNKNEEIYNYMQEASRKYNLFYARSDLVDKSSGEKTQIEIGLFGNVESNVESLDITYLGQKILDKDRLNKLFSSEDTDVVISNDISVDKNLYYIPKFANGSVVVFKKFDSQLERSGTMNGEYKILGLSQDEQDSFLEGLARVSGLSKESFTDNIWGRYLDRNGTIITVGGIIFAHTLVLLGVFSYLAISNLKNLGTLILQGWSRGGFVKYIYSKYVWLGIINVPLSLLYGSFFAYNSMYTVPFFVLFALVGILNLLFMIFLLGLASLLIFW